MIIGANGQRGIGVQKISKLSDLTWSQKIIDGGYPDAPHGAPSLAPETWPVVEERLGYGVGKRRVRYLLTDPLARQTAKVFYPPEWWDVHSVQEAAQSVDDRGELTGEWVYRDPKPRKDGGALIRLGWVTVIEATIDCPEMGIPEAVRYALTWQEMLPKSGRG
ncbi:MAG: hypothetical protein RIG84_17780 [Roseovarius sp.]